MEIGYLLYLLFIGVNLKPCVGLSGPNVCSSTSYYSSSRQSCGWADIFKWWCTTRYSQESNTESYCCSGYGEQNGGCYPLCAGRLNPYACTRNEGYILQRDGTVITNSGGTCSLPNVCTNCNNGYYSSSDGYCRVCTAIPYCNDFHCERISDSVCQYCHGEVKATYGWYAFTRFTDAGISCKQACSWRPGARCYPGNCPEITLVSCRCHNGFSGVDCATIDDKPKLLQKMLTFSHHTEVVEVPKLGSEYTFVNLADLSEANGFIEGNFNRELPSPPLYIRTEDTKLGIVRGYLLISLQRGSRSFPGIGYTCDSYSHPIPNNFRCEGNFDISTWDLPFQHNDTVKFNIELRNGGFVTYYDRENNNIGSYDFNGKSLLETYFLVFDFENPTHCVYEECPLSPMDMPDTQSEGNTKVQWGGWSDYLAGVDFYSIEVFHLIPMGAIADTTNLTHGDKLTNTPVSISAKHSSADVSLSISGPYSIILTVFDKAGNHKSARRIMIYDNVSSVEQQGNATVVTTASKETGYTWMTEKGKPVDVQWYYRFINKLHYTGQWLNAVDGLAYVDAELEDHEGERTVSRSDNSFGIVRFEIDYVVTLRGVNKEHPFKAIADVHTHAITLNETLEDGMRINTTVRAYDIMGRYADESVVVKVDYSPPVIENLWLTKDNLLNLSIHSLEEFTEMTIEWEAYDYHSGLNNLQWRLYDNYTGNKLLYGITNISPQGEADTLDECNNRYWNYSRGPDCYCTPFDGCFHKHFQVKPTVRKFEGLLEGKHVGVHDSDYYIEITTTNRALLTTVAVLKITIDITPPHSGVVHDGIKGEPEVDFQQSLTLHANWDGFFDRESGVRFYKYRFSEACLGAENFDSNFNDSNNSLQTTYLTSATFLTPKEGIFYVTVAAYNNALEPSSPVCSDGVVIDNSPIVISDVVVEKAWLREGLVKDNSGTVWFLDSRRILHKTRYNDDTCRNRANLIDDEIFRLLPKKTGSKGTFHEMDSNKTCKAYSGVHITMLGVLSSIINLRISWNTSEPSRVHDYELGISWSATEEPNIYKSTNGHQHYQFNYPDISDGQQFYIHLKSISRSAVMSLKAIGPFIVDTTAPEFSGNINVTYKDEYLIATWEKNSFVDQEDVYMLLYNVAIGHSRYGVDVKPYSVLKSESGCVHSNPPTCTSINVHELSWSLHENQVYYITVMVENTAGLTTMAVSNPYIHNTRLPTVGIVMDVDVTRPQIHQDIDFQGFTDSLSAQWKGFFHPTLAVSYSFCIGKTSGSDDVYPCTSVGKNTSHTQAGITLNILETFFVTIVALTESGNVNTSSDGVTVVRENMELVGVEVFDGKPCDGQDTAKRNFTHHSEDKRIHCQADTDYQSTTNHIGAYWRIPDTMLYLITEVYWAVEQTAHVVDYWTEFRSYESIGSAREAIETYLVLEPGRSYRTALKFCGDDVCYKPLYTNGITVTSNPPKTGRIDVKYIADNKQLRVTLEKFSDPDIDSKDEAYEVIDHYEWAFTDNSHDKATITRWERLTYMDVIDANYISFTLKLKSAIAFSKCRRISVRGYNKAGLSSVASEDIVNCTDSSKISPKIVIDAVSSFKDGSRDSDEGSDINLEENALWTQPDVDYTPYNNILSAVWPSLRYFQQYQIANRTHGHYKWAVLELITDDSTTFYENDDELKLLDPASHPDAIKSGETDSEFINVHFEDPALYHGKRYIICIHANATVLEHEKWDQSLPEISTCSDGVTVDLTPPKAGKMWIGNSPNSKYQTSSTDMIIHWESFTDVEEMRNQVHSTGVKSYRLAIGSVPNGFDVWPFTDVGITNHAAIHSLRLQSGHSYFATVIAEDFVGRSTKITSSPIIIDITPPEVGDSAITINQRHITNTSSIKACWWNVFTDFESGIQKYEWSVGSRPTYDDIMEFTSVFDTCATSDNYPFNLAEGNTYFISVKAYNWIGLVTLVSSWGFLVDQSPPVSGQVYDGRSRTEDGSQKDVDYQSEKYSLQVSWEGFFDPHTNIRDYYISVGVGPYRDDLLSQTPVGILKDVFLKNLKLVEGVKYYSTVTACNTADLCTSVSSDGVIIDITPPIKGKVFDGLDTRDIQYQASSNTCGAKWFGFADAQSGISHYVWRAGTTPGGDDLLRPTDVHLSTKGLIVDVQSKYNYSLPTLNKIYITVRVYNKAGLYTESTSNGFVIDTSPPEISAPSLVDGSFIVPNTSIYRSVLKIRWDADDRESYIERQYLSLKSHVNGDFNVSSIEVVGLARDYILTDLQMHDGSEYSITLIACNGAKLCSTKTSNIFLVDSTPPNRGMFAINTNHAAGLDRQMDSWMKWTNMSVHLAWLGFSDLHSGISHYGINIGSSYMGSDLNEVPGVEIKVTYHTDGKEKAIEGLFENSTIMTQKLHGFETVFISMSAVNRVGLTSPMIHSQFRLTAGGSMELVRRCSAYSCLGHCVCSPQDQLCEVDGLTCQDITGVVNTYLSVKDIHDLRFVASEKNVQYSAADHVIAAKWEVSPSTSFRPLWYEWSIGYSKLESPSGVFNRAKEREWHDAGQRTKIVVSLPKGCKLKEGVSYSFWIRAWYNGSTYSLFKSKGVTIDNMPPRVIKQFKTLKELTNRSSKDVDFVNENDTITIDWAGKFAKASDMVDRFKLYISTNSAGHDTHVVDVDFPGNVTQYNLTGVSLKHGTQYFSNVIAYNHAGLHTTQVSDGFQLDTEPPVSGVVYDGTGLHDIEYQNSSNLVSASWRGFTDTGSGIRNYLWCISSKPVMSPPCDVMGWENVVIRTSKQKTLDRELTAGFRVYHKVVAEDVVGHKSLPVASSNGFVIDTTPPKLGQNLALEDNLVMNPSFEDDFTSSQVEELNFTNHCRTTSLTHWILSTDSCVDLVETRAELVRDGKNFIVVEGVLSQALHSLEIDKKYAVEFYTSHFSANLSLVSRADGYIALDGDIHSFSTYTRPRFHQQDAPILSWQRHIFVFTVTKEKVNISIGSMNGASTIFALDAVQVRGLTDRTTSGKEIVNALDVSTVLVEDWFSIHATWLFDDPESPIVDYQWAIGLTQGGTQLQTFQSVGTRTFAYNSTLQPSHNSTVHVTVVATNAAGLKTSAYSEPYLIDLTPPAVEAVNDGTGEDIDYQDTFIVSANWKVVDQESGVDTCYWAIGSKAGSNDIRDFAKADSGHETVSTAINSSVLSASTVYVTVRCTNGMGLQSTKSTDGIRIVTVAPSAEHAVVEVMGTSTTQYPVKDNYHADPSQLRIRWSGFNDDARIHSYVVDVQGPNLHLSKTVKNKDSEFTYAHLVHLDLTDGKYEVFVTAVNEISMQSQRSSTNVTVLTTPPILTGNSISINWDQHSSMISSSWEAAFQSEYPLYYEVTVGSYIGSADILQWQETKDTSLMIHLPAADVPASGKDIFITVRAINPCGLYSNISKKTLISG